MKAVFNIKLTVDGRDVVTKVGVAEGLDDMEITLLQNVLRSIADTQKRVKQQIDRFYGAPEGTVDNSETADLEPKEEAEAGAVASKTEEQE